MWADANIQPSELGTWLIAAALIVGTVAGLLTIAVLIKQLTKQPPHSEAPVTRKEWEDKHDILTQEVRKAQDDLHDLQRQVENLNHYTHERTHNVLEGLQPILSKIELMSRKFDKFLNGGEKP